MFVLLGERTPANTIIKMSPIQHTPAIPKPIFLFLLRLFHSSLISGFSVDGLVFKILSVIFLDFKSHPYSH